MLAAILADLGVDTPAPTRQARLAQLNATLLARHEAGRRVVVFVEEAQGIALEILEFLRLLTNLETATDKLLQIVLFGQPELDRKLELKEIRQLRERITHSFNLSPLSTDEIREYLHFRLSQAGCPWPQLFSPKAEIMLAKASGGLSRRINILADKALLAAYADPATRPDARNSAGERLPVVFPRHVRTAVADSSYRSLDPPRLLRWTGYAAAALGGAVVVGLALWLLEPAAQPTVPQQLAEAAVPPQAPEPATAVEAEPVSEPAPDPAPEPVVDALAESAAVPAAPQQAAGTDAVPEPPAAAAPQQPAPQAGAVIPQAEATAAPDTTAGSTVATTVAETVAPMPAAAETLATAAPPEAQAAPAPQPPASAVEPQPAVVAAAEPQTGAVADSPVTAEGPAPAAQSPASAAEPRAEGLTGLIRSRFLASAPWLEALPQKSGYSLQLYSVATDNSSRLEEFLEFLVLYDMLDNTWLCLISGNSRRQEQWLVLHGEFSGLSEAREFMSAARAFARPAALHKSARTLCPQHGRHRLCQ